MRVLLLTPWLFHAPRNGGQLRASAVARAYRAAGHHVHGGGLYHPAETPAGEARQEDIPLAPGVIRIMAALAPEQARSEMTFWNAVAAAPDSLDAYAGAVREASPDVLQFEEPALWPVVRGLRAAGHLDDVAIVHSSYNFETVAWQHRSVPGTLVTDETLRDIAAIEREIAASCDLVIAVSDGDAAEFRQLGAARVCVAANGVASLLPGEAADIGSYMPSGVPYALFVSSAHPPNAHGLVDLAAGVSGHPVRHGEIIVCGRVGTLVRNAANFERAGRVLGRARFLGWVDDACLGALYGSAGAVILPKAYSGGSNLKTAEALASGRPVVATRRAFEGFEAFMDLPGVTITDDPDLFWRAVDDHLASPVGGATRTPGQMSGLLWEECLKPMVRAAEEVVHDRARARQRVRSARLPA